MSLNEESLFHINENVILGELGYGSVWSFEYSSAHSHWHFNNENEIEINWGKYGVYVLTIDGENKKLSGSAKGQPTNWRKASYIRSLTAEEISSTGHGHDHEHSH
eukprot:gene20425-26504_t